MGFHSDIPQPLNIHYIDHSRHSLHRNLESRIEIHEEDSDSVRTDSESQTHHQDLFSHHESGARFYQGLLPLVSVEYDVELKTGERISISGDIDRDFHQLSRFPGYMGQFDYQRALAVSIASRDNEKEENNRNEDIFADD